MRNEVMSKSRSGVRSVLGAVAGLLVGATVLPGCLVVDNGGGGGGGGYYNYAPYIADAYVSCAYDSYYQTGVWDFVTFVDDPDGYLDVTEVWVDVIDMVYNPSAVAETWNLAYDVNGQWSQTIYEDNGSGNPNYYSQVLDCYYLYDFEFDFYAYDYYGDGDAVTFVP